jgi:hypothetical protein
MLEESVEEHLRLGMVAAGGRCEKVVDLSRVGHPDRECQWPGRPVLDGWWVGAIDKVELKRPGGDPESHQSRYHRFYARCNVPVYLLDTKEKVDRYLAARKQGRHVPELFSVPCPNL